MTKVLHPTRTPLPMLGAIAVIVLALLPGRAQAGALERWYLIEIEGQRAGHMVVSEEPEGEHIRTRSFLKVEMKRDALVIPITMESVWLETRDGKPVSLTATSRFGLHPTIKTYRFGGEGVELESKVGRQVTRRSVPAPEGEWLPPAAAKRQVEAQLAAGEKTISTRTVEEQPLTGLIALTTTRTLLERANVDVIGRLVPALKWKIEVAELPQVATVEFVDENGELVRGESEFGGLKMVTILADRELALSPADPPELLNTMLVVPDRPIAGARKLEAGTYLLSIDDGQMPDLPVTPVQSVERVGKGEVRVSVRTAGAPGPPGAGPPGDDPRFAAPSAMVKSDDPRIIELVKEALPKDIPDASARARKLRRFVHGFIQAKEMSVGFASASEVARTRTGDCTEHGVLLAALLRGSGIPSRVVSGLIYVDLFAGKPGVFGYHMWTQAWLPSPGGGPAGWVDLDATLPGADFDAAHITLGTSALTDAETENFMVTLAPLLKRLRIKVESTTP